MSVTEVKPGQLWARGSRRIRINSVDSRHAEIYGWDEDRIGDGRRGRILLEGVTQRYTLVDEATA